jgi:rubrerythrin
MGANFSADEILQVAEQIERNGAKFYRKAAEGTADEKAKKTMLDLAEMEDGHEKTFAAMRTELSGRAKEATAFDPQGEATLYLKAFADGKVFDPNADPAERLTGDETPLDVITTAIGAEKDSIVFYLGIKDVVSEKLGKDKIDAIIKEERSHLTILAGILSEL